MVMAATGSKSAAGATMKSAAQSNTKTTTKTSSSMSSGVGGGNYASAGGGQGSGTSYGGGSKTNTGSKVSGGTNSNPSGARDGGGNGGNNSYGGSTTSRIGSAASAQRMSSAQASSATSSAPNAAAAKASAAYRASGALNAGLGRDPSPISGALNTQRNIGVGGAALGSFRTVNDVAVRNYTAGPVSPDVSYQMRFNPGTRANIDRIVGAKVVGTNPGINWGNNPNYGQIGNLYNQTISGESVFKGPKATLDQMSVANTIANRLRMASEGVGLPGNFPANATYAQVMRGFDANGIRRPDTFVDNYNTQGLNRQIGYGTTALGSLSPNSGLNQAKVNPAVARDVGSYYGMTPSNVQNVANATHYYNANVVTPSWANNLRNVGTFGSHRFGTADVTDQQVASLGQRAASGAAPASLFDTMQQSIGTFSNLLDKTDLQTPKRYTDRVPVGDGVSTTGMPFRADASPGLPPGYAKQYFNTATVTPPSRYSGYGTFNGPTIVTTPDPNASLPNYAGFRQFAQPANPPIPRPRPEPQNYPVKPYGSGTAKAIDAVVNVTPGAGVVNMIGGLFGKSAGDIYTSEENKLANMTPEQRERYRSYWGDKRANSVGRGPENRGDTRPAMSLVAAASSPQATNAPAETPVSGNWQADALAYGYSEAQLKDPEIRALIKELWDMGFIPKTSTT